MLIDCKKTVTRMEEEIKAEVNSLKEQGIEPCLAIIQVEGVDASNVYVRNKHKKCEEMGIKSINCVLPRHTPEEVLISIIYEYNKNPEIHGIMVQLPLPAHINATKVINMISPLKDADCLTAANIGNLFTTGVEDITVPCTPLGIMNILKDNNIELEGKNALIINRSMLVGKPLVELLQRENATVTLAHSKSNKILLDPMNLDRYDIVITAVGIPNFIPANQMLFMNNTVFIDVSMNRDENGKLCGDIDKELYDSKEYLITPVPGGVGTTTVISLLANTITCCKKQKERGLI